MVGPLPTMREKNDKDNINKGQRHGSGPESGVGSASFRGGPESGGKVIWLVSIHLLIGSFSNFLAVCKTIN